MVSVYEAIQKAQKEHKIVVKVIYFNKSVEYYLHDVMPDKNEYIPDGYSGHVRMVADYSIH